MKPEDEQEARYREAVASYGAAVERLAAGYERDTGLRQDLVQDIHIALWQSFAIFDGRCSLRTWVYRVAHNVATTHTDRQRRRNRLAALDEAAAVPAPDNLERSAEDAEALRALYELIDKLKPPDRQIVLLYLENLDAVAIGEITGFSPAAVGKRIQRAKTLLATGFSETKTHA